MGLLFKECTIKDQPMELKIQNKMSIFDHLNNLQTVVNKRVMIGIIDKTRFHLGK